MLLSRLDKFLTDANICTRSEAKKLISGGKVKVNRIVIKDPKTKVTNTDIVSVNEQIIKPLGLVYILLNKPGGYVCANKDNLYPTVFELLDEQYRNIGLSCVGRLDVDTEGLLLLTNDGSFNHNITSPKKHIPKTYFVRLQYPLTNDNIYQLEKGVLLTNENYTTKTAIVSKYTDTECTITIQEGKFHQVKRMFLAVGNKVIYLKRISIGNIVLDDTLELGDYKLIDKNDLHM